MCGEWALVELAGLALSHLHTPRDGQCGGFQSLLWLSFQEWGVGWAARSPEPEDPDFLFVGIEIVRTSSIPPDLRSSSMVDAMVGPLFIHQRLWEFVEAAAGWKVASDILILKRV